MSVILDAELERAAFVVLDLTFRPFQTQYGHFVEKISYHEQVFGDERALIQTKLLIAHARENRCGEGPYQKVAKLASRPEYQ